MANLIDNTFVSNLALGYLKAKSVDSISDPNTRVEQILADLLPITTKAFLESTDFTFSKGRVRLLQDLLAQADFDTAEGKVYLLPTDYCGLRFLHDPKMSLDEVDYDIEGDYLIVGDQLYTDETSVLIGYTKYIDDYNKYSASAVRALAAELAMEAGFQITGRAESVAQIAPMRDRFLLEAGNTDLRSRPNRVETHSTLAGARQGRAGPMAGIYTRPARVG